MSLDPAARVYAEALYEAAVEENRLEAVRGDLNDLSGALASSHDLALALFNPAFPEPAKKQIITQFTAGADELVRNALLVLVDRGRLEILPDLIEEFEDRAAEADNVLGVELTTAIPIGDDEAEALRARLRDQTDREVKLERRVDPAILGGVVLRSGDLLIDASLRGRLDGLRLTLRQVRLATTGGSE
jgi:F-type H+-transporting ATPase subunit delta